jgi:hypothetical protein
MIIDGLNKYVREFAISVAILIGESLVPLFIRQYIRLDRITLTIIANKDIRVQSTLQKIFTETLGTKLCFCTILHYQMDSLAKIPNNIVEIFI